MCSDDVEFPIEVVLAVEVILAMEVVRLLEVILALPAVVVSNSLVMGSRAEEIRWLELSCLDVVDVDADADDVAALFVPALVVAGRESTIGMREGPFESEHAVTRTSTAIERIVNV